MATDAPVRIVLGGALGKRFGAEWNLRLSKASPAEAVRAINANTKGEFRRYLIEQGEKRFYKVAVGRKDNLLSKEELQSPTGRCTIYILPTIRGREKAATKIIIGATLIALAIINPLASGAVITTMLASAGASLVIGGVIQLLTPVPSFDHNNEADGATSDIFQGNAAAVYQGAAIPLVYGRALVPAVPVSLSFTAFDKSAVNSTPPQEYDIEYGDGGIVNYVARGIGSNIPGRNDNG